MTHLFKMTPIGRALLAGGALLSIVLIAFRNMGLLPVGAGDFVFFAILTVCIAAYRPGWMFLLLVMSLPLEMIDLAPARFGIEFRPYQFLEVALVSGLLVRFLARRALPEIPKPTFPDVLLLLVPIGSLLALVNAPSFALSFKLSLVLLSLYGLYALGRTYLRSFDDIRKVLPFALTSGAIVLSYAIFQNIRFLHGVDPFQVMPGRPDGVFPEPDWLGMYLVFFGSLLLAIFSGMFQGRFPESFRDRSWKFFAASVPLTIFFVVLLMTVARSAWLGMAVSGFIAIALFAYARRGTKARVLYAGGIAGSFFLALMLVVFIPLTRFDLFSRAVSTAGWQEITVACHAESIRSAALPERITDMSELEAYDCRHINLEEIGIEESLGNSVATVFRPDPNVHIRKDIYGSSWEKIKEHPILGIGWGSIAASLGTDGRGASLNASNVFLEVWLGSGFLGILGLVWFLVSVLIRAAQGFFCARAKDGPSYDGIAFPVFVLSVVFGLTVFNLFNAGILLGFLWILFAALLVSEDR